GDFIIQIRNLTTSTLELPQIEAVNGKLALGKGARLEYCYFGNDTRSIQGVPNVLASSTSSPLVIEPRAVRTVAVPVRSLLDAKAKQAYHFNLRVDGFAPSNQVTLFVSDRINEKWWDDPKEAWWLPA